MDKLEEDEKGLELWLLKIKVDQNLTVFRRLFLSIMFDQSPRGEIFVWHEAVILLFTRSFWALTLSSIANKAWCVIGNINKRLVKTDMMAIHFLILQLPFLLGLIPTKRETQSSVHMSLFLQTMRLRYSEHRGNLR